ncbi:hypothetical protein JZ751_025981, partial [Albula glossodonta]
MSVGQRDYGGGGVIMAALSEEGRYRLSCGRNGNTASVLHVKLTEAVYRALKNYQNCKNALSAQPTIQFKGQHGSIKIPRTDNPTDLVSFDFFVSSIGKDGPQGSFECVQQNVPSYDMPHLSCLGTVQEKITVCASNSQAPQECPLQAELTTRKRETRRVPFRKPAPSSSPSDLVPERKRSTPINPASLLRKAPPNPPVSQARYRDRVVHLLALRPHKKLAVLARLQRDKINPKDLGSTLQQVANLNPKDNTFSLKDHLYREVRADWPGYSEEERAQLEQILARKFGVQCESPSTSSPKQSISTSQQRDCQDYDFIDPLMPKKPRISHINNRAPTTPPQSDSHAPHLPASNPPLPLSSRSPSTPEGCGTQALPMDSFGHTQSSRVDQSQSAMPVPTPEPTLKRREGSIGKKAKKRSKKHRDREDDHTPPTAKIAKSDREAVVSMTQRQSYKDDFNAEYEEYCALHARVESITRHFTKLDAQCKLLQPGTKEYKASPSYREMKQRCEYLHNKLAHIKRLIAEFDQWRARAWDYSANRLKDG